MSRRREPSQRQLRVGEELRHALASIFAHGDLRDPAIAERPVTVTEVRVSPDLRNATVYVSPLGGGDDTALLAALQRARPYLPNRLGSLMVRAEVRWDTVDKRPGANNEFIKNKPALDGDDDLGDLFSNQDQVLGGVEIVSFVSCSWPPACWRAPPRRPRRW